MNAKIKEIISSLQNVMTVTKDEGASIEIILNEDGFIDSNVKWHQDEQHLMCRIRVDTKALDRSKINWLYALLIKLEATIDQNKVAISDAIEARTVHDNEQAKN